MPADTGVDQRGASFFYSFAQLDHLLPAATFVNQIEHRQAVNNDELRPDTLADAADNLNRQPHPLLIVAAPVVVALVGALNNKLVNEIAFRAHDFDTVVAGILCQRCATDKVVNLLPDFIF